MPLGRNILAVRRRGIEGVGLQLPRLQAPVPTVVEPPQRREGITLGDFRQPPVSGDPITLPAAEFRPEAQPADITRVAQPPQLSEAAQQFIETFSVRGQPTIGQAPGAQERLQQEAIREEVTGLAPTTGVGLPRFKQALRPPGGRRLLGRAVLGARDLIQRGVQFVEEEVTGVPRSPFATGLPTKAERLFEGQPERFRTTEELTRPAVRLGGGLPDLLDDPSQFERPPRKALPAHQLVRLALRGITAIPQFVLSVAGAVLTPELTVPEEQVTRDFGTNLTTAAQEELSNLRQLPGTIVPAILETARLVSGDSPEKMVQLVSEILANPESSIGSTFKAVHETITGQEFTVETFKEIINEIYLAPETPVFAAALARGGGKLAVKSGKAILERVKRAREVEPVSREIVEKAPEILLGEKSREGLIERGVIDAERAEGQTRLPGERRGGLRGIDRVRSTETRDFQATSRGNRRVTEPTEYTEAINEALAEHPYRHQVTFPSESEVRGYVKEGGTVLLSKDGKAGAIVKPDGELGHLFNTPEKTKSKRVVDLLEDVIEAGATWAESFDTYLPGYYGRFGFTPVAKVRFKPEFAPEGWPTELYKDFNNGQPDILFYARDGVIRSRAEMVEVVKGLEYVDDFDAGVAIAKSKGFKFEVPEPGLTKAEIAKRAAGGIAGVGLTIAALTSDDKTNALAIGLPLAFFGRKGKKPKKAAGQFKASMESTQIDGLKAEVAKFTVPPESTLRPGVKLPKAEIADIRRSAAANIGITLTETRSGRLVAPKGKGAALTEAVKIEQTRRQAQAARDQGIAMRLTKGGKIVPNVRKSGVFVPNDFTDFGAERRARAPETENLSPKQQTKAEARINSETTGFREISRPSFRLTDPIRVQQEMDGLTEQQLRSQPGQQGPVMRFVETPRRQMELQKQDFVGQTSEALQNIFQELSKNDRTTITGLLEQMSSRGAYVDPATLAESSRFKSRGATVDLISRTQQLRRWYDSIRVRENEMRILRAQKEIPFRKFYSPETIAQTGVLGKFLGEFQNADRLMRSADLPDYIQPEATFTPHALARRGVIPDWLKERDAATLAERYANASTADMFDTSILQLYKAFANEMESMGFPRNAAWMREYATRNYAGIRNPIDRYIPASDGVRRIGSIWRQGLARSVFPGNIRWLLFTQPASLVFTYARYGGGNMIRGLKWFTDRNLRNEIGRDMFSFRVKTGQSGRVREQDIAGSNVANVRARIRPIDTFYDWANFLIDFNERHLTGYSIATALEHGKQLGLKGQALREYASDGGSKTQSMYNMSGLPDILTSELVKTIAPFQTFKFEALNTVKEIFGRTGIPPTTLRNRFGFMARLVAGSAAVNYIGNTAVRGVTGEIDQFSGIWNPTSFIPFYNILLEPIWNAFNGRDFESTRAVPSPVAGGIELSRGVSDYMRTGRTRKLRNAFLRYGTGILGVPAGTQMAKTVDGLIAVSEGGMFDRNYKPKFTITEAGDQVRAIVLGPWQTKPGQDYLDTRQRSFLDIFHKEPKALKKQLSTKRTQQRNLIKSKRFDEAIKLTSEWNSTYGETEFALPTIDQTLVDVQKRKQSEAQKKQRELRGKK